MFTLQKFVQNFMNRYYDIMQHFAQKIIFTPIDWFKTITPVLHFYLQKNTISVYNIKYSPFNNFHSQFQAEKLGLTDNKI